MKKIVALFASFLFAQTAIAKPKGSKNITTNASMSPKLTCAANQITDIGKQFAACSKMSDKAKEACVAKAKAALTEKYPDCKDEIQTASEG